MGNFFSDLFGGSDPEIMTQTVEDKNKKAVSDPLSAFLARNVGTGLPRYPGELTAPLPYEGGASVNPFLQKSVDDLYNPIQENAIKTFKNNYSDLLESSAGALSSSSRAYNDNTALTNLQLGLADKRSALELGLPMAQYDIAGKMQAANTLKDQAQYQDWLKSLPEYNPILDKALAYLNEQTSSGTTLLSALDPGKKAGIYDVINAVTQIIGAAKPSVPTPGCWVASEIFGGWYAPKTISCRYFIYNIAPKWFSNLYTSHGPALSFKINQNKVLRETLKPIFEVFSFIGGIYAKRS